MLDYKIACERFTKEVVDALFESVKKREDKAVVTDGEQIFVCSSVGTFVPDAFERVEGQPWVYDPAA
jgi:hypothetical protein